ncbi:uncharacterized protein si:ch211-241j12.3 isoform X1 [Puntigrus tetrazona]|uniref:uncharacterized protein si:ch211-241j12.3 isoform X1 n=1 Tax=Puntigrus tetrazona TaxID=1606681 RepID=UPI001C8A3821|nr:uncharacterized protein si:ch211-241j12.3 isoform X1 [Puntigrus tetrazona]
MALRRLLTSAGAVPLHDLQLALQWQYEFLKGHRKTSDITSPVDEHVSCGLPPPDSDARVVSQCESLCDLAKWPSAGKPPSLSSFDSGFDGADGRSRREPPPPRILGNGDFAFKTKPVHGQIDEENIVSVSDSEDPCEEMGFSLKRDSTHASIQIVPKMTSDSLNLEIKVKRSATLPKNPWLSLPIDDLESSYTVTITPSTSRAPRSRARDGPSPAELLRAAPSQESFEEPELAAVGNVLSSTLTDHEDRPSCTVDGDPSLLWDSFDLHNLRQDSYQRLDVSLGDWVQREQQELREVEETLDRAAEILQEEEDVLAQEVVLDELLRSEDLNKHWPVWTEGHQLSTMTPRELAESGVIGLDGDVLQSDLTSTDSETLRSCEVCEDSSGSSDRSPSTCEGPEPPDTGCPEEHRPGVLRELRDIRVLEEQIMEERVKLEALRLRETELDPVREKEKPPETMERSARRRSSRGHRVVTCSVMERNSALKDLDDELLRSCGLQPLPDSDQPPRTDSAKSPSDAEESSSVRPDLTDSSLTSESGTLEPGRDVSPPLQAQDGGHVRGAFDPGGVWMLDEERPPSDCDAPAAVPSTLMQNNNNNRAVLCRGESPGPQGCDGSMRAAGSGSTVQLQASSRQMSDYKTPIVLDSGSGLMKAGFADQDLPTSVFPSVIGRPKYEEVMNGSVEREQYVGHDAQHMRGVLTLKYPIRNGVVTNWDEMEMIWHHAFQQLCVCPEDHPVLLTEAAMNPLQNRQRSVELMFEVFGVPLTFVALQAVLALYASGRTTGVVLDSGDGVTHSVPVFEGYCLPHAVQRLDLAGSHVTLQLQKLLLEQGVCLQTSAELEIVREMKERCCCVALDFAGELKSASELPYTLPDGRLVSLASERFRAPEILFRPELIGRDHYGMHESLFRSVLQSDIDLRRSFLGNILLSGGNTLLPGLPARLQQEMSALCPAGPSVRVSSPSDRDFSVWRGGAALAHTAELGGAWISADEYEEFGPQIVFRKCF